MNRILTSEWFLILGVTLASTMLGIFIKFASRNDRHQGFKHEDLAVGLDLLVTALILLITDTVDDFLKFKNSPIQESEKEILGQSISEAPWIILTFVFGTWAVSTVVRKVGWETGDQLRPGWGILFPNVIGITGLVLVFIWTKG
jgi:hypothetical protein